MGGFLFLCNQQL